MNYSRSSLLFYLLALFDYPQILIFAFLNVWCVIIFSYFLTLFIIMFWFDCLTFNNIISTWTFCSKLSVLAHCNNFLEYTMCRWFVKIRWWWWSEKPVQERQHNWHRFYCLLLFLACGLYCQLFIWWHLLELFLFSNFVCFFFLIPGSPCESYWLPVDWHCWGWICEFLFLWFTDFDRVWFCVVYHFLFSHTNFENITFFLNL